MAINASDWSPVINKYRFQHHKRDLSVRPADHVIALICSCIINVKYTNIHNCENMYYIFMILMSGLHLKLCKCTHFISVTSSGTKKSVALVLKKAQR